MKIYDVTPVESFFISLKDLPELERSGLFELQISNASYGWKMQDGTICPPGFDFTDPKNAAQIKNEWVRLNCAVLGKDGNKTEAVHLMFSLSSTHPQDLAYFLNFRTEDGKIYFPDAAARQAENKSTGEKFWVYEYEGLIGKRVHALLEYRGKRASGQTLVSDFNLIGFCDAQGRGAYEHETGAYEGMPRPAYRNFLAQAEQLNAQPPAPYGAMSSQQAGFTAPAVQPPQYGAMGAQMPQYGAMNGQQANPAGLGF